MYLPTGSLQDRAVLNINCIRVRLFSRHLFVIFLFPLSGFKPTSMEQVNSVTETILCIRIGLDDWLAWHYAERINAILYQYFGRIIRFCSTNVIRRITPVKISDDKSWSRNCMDELFLLWQMKHFRSHLRHLFPDTVNQVIITTAKCSK